MIKIKAVNFFNNNLSTPVLISSFISLIFGVVSTQFSSNITIPLGYLIICFCVNLFVIWILLIVIFSKSKDATISLELVSFLPNRDHKYCMLKPCNYLSTGAYITIFYLENNFETYFATGIVHNVQDDKFIQIKFIHFVDDADLISNAFNNNSAFLGSIILKPIITNKFNEECN